MKNLSFSGLPRVLLVCGEQDVREGLRSLLHHEGLSVETVDGIDDAARRAAERVFDVVLLDSELLESASHAWSVTADLRRGPVPADVVLLGGLGAAASAVEAMRHGIADVVDTPYDTDRLLAALRRGLDGRRLGRELSWLQDRVRELTSTELVGLSPAIRSVQQRIEQVAPAPDAAVLVTGARGTGKELVARSVHERGARRHGPFVTVNCAALGEAQLEDELFGHEAGAFAGGMRDQRDGVLAVAAGGTLFLDEIAALPASLQHKLARVLQDRSFRRIGGVQDLPVDVRVVASTCEDLRALVQQGRFREDLFYRLDAMAIAVPTLAERSEDVPLLSHFFLDQLGRQMGKSLTGFSDDAMETLCEYGWPGNVRELRCAVEQACIACPGGVVEESHLPRFTGGALDGSDRLDSSAVVLESADRSIRALESQLVAKVLEDTQWNISRAANILGINRTTLYNKIRVYDLGERPSRGKVGELMP